MAASKESILHALENSLFEFPELPGRWEVPSFWVVRAHATPQTSHPIGNLVGVSTLTKSAEKPRHSCRGGIGVGRAGLNAQEPNKTHAVPEPSMGEGTA